VRAVDILRKKRDGQALDPREIEAFVAGVTTRAWPDYQAAALLMAIVIRGMNAEETAALTRAMAFSGQTLDLSALPGPKVDKHSTGGVGDNASLVLAPLAAACGVMVPMMSGRGLGHTGGTLDKLEAIPGFRVHLGLGEFRDVLQDVGCAMIGQTEEIAPADKLLYALRDVTATVESIPLITASIMSKKIAEGIDALVLDVKCGAGAFMKNRADAEALARSLVENGRENGVRTAAVLTAMDVPLGRAVGNALEVRECLDTLRGQGPGDVEELAVHLAARMVHLGTRISLQDAEHQVRQALAGGQGLEKFRRLIERQGGDPRVVDKPDLLPAAPHQALLRAKRPGYVIDIHAEQVGRAAVLLGAGRDRVEDTIDPAVGVLIKARRGEEVRADDALAEIHYRDPARLAKALALLEEAWTLGDEGPSEKPLIMDAIE
jgi:pyrimidine-nucleoside phosphorylase